MKKELGGVPLAGFSVVAEELNLDVKDDTLSYSGEYRKTDVMDEAALKQAKRRFASIIERVYGVESYDLELDDDSLDVAFEQSRSMVTVDDAVYAAREYVPYISVTITLTTEGADGEEGDEAARARYTTLEYNIDITLERRVVRLQVGQRDARINGKARSLEVAPFVVSGRTLVPLRFIGEQMDAVFRWDPEEKEITFVKGTVTIKIRLGEDEAHVHAKGTAPRVVVLDVPARVVEGRTVVPLRFVSDNLGATVRWNPDDRSIIVRQ